MLAFHGRHRLFATALLVASTLAVDNGQAQVLESASSWTLDARLAAAPTPASARPSANPLAGHRGLVSRQAITRVWAGAMLGAVVGVALLDDGPDLICVLPEQAPSDCPSSPRDSDAPVLVGALVGAAAGFLYHLLAGRDTNAGT